MMKRMLCCVLAVILTVGAFVGCGKEDNIYGAHLTDTALDENGKMSRNAPIMLSGFEDVTDENGEISYQMVADLTDNYVFRCASAAAITVTTPAGTVEGITSIAADVTAGDTVTVTVKADPLQKVCVSAEAKKHEKRLPYAARFTVDPATLDVSGNGDAPKATEISYQKREGGTYVYLNNPEKLQPADIGQAILRDEGLSGEVQVTWEHSNFTEKPIYLGYQLKNEGETDVFVTVTNVGYQTSGEWLGQQSWSDYYNYEFTLPDDYFTLTGVESERYRGQDFIKYKPRVFHPTTYRIPAGEYIYVVGGTSGDAYNNTNVDDTADQLVSNGRCTNAAVRFLVTGGAVTGTFYCYNDPAQVKAEPEEQGYITMRDGTQFGYQYKGVDYHAGLIESNPVFIVNDETESGSLPVVYENQYDEFAWTHETMYEAYNSQKNTVERHSWVTNINPQGNHAGIGTDMSTFECVTTDGETVVLDNEHADGTGRTGNFGNWMIDYHDNMTFVNQGDRPRTFTINKHANGALMAYVADTSGKVLTTKCTIVPIEDSSDYRQWEIYKVEVPAHSTVQLTVSFLLMGNSYGAVSHWVDVE